MRLSYTLVFFVAVCLSSGCVSHKELLNFDTVRVPQGKSEEIENALELQIQSKDLLRIEVESVDELAAAPFNRGASGGGGNVSQASSQNIQLFQGYLVDEDGYVDLPLLGRVKAAGQTVESLQFLVRGKLKTYLKDPVVNIRYLNFKVTILGEVNVPGVVTLPNSRVTLLEALGMAGDLSDYADRTSVLIVREQDGVRSYKRVNLQSDEIFSSEYYYLKQNDMIYVEPIQARTATVSDPGRRVLPYIATALSTVTFIIALSRN